MYKVLSICSLVFLVGICTTFAQAAIWVGGRQPIPRTFGDREQPYTSWSLFLATREWLSSGGTDRLRTLYDAYMQFGTSVGPDHLAVWFWKDSTIGAPAGTRPDFERSAAFLRALRKLPSASPCVLVTTSYPGEGLLMQWPNGFPTKVEGGFLMELGALSDREIESTLLRLADQLVAHGVPTSAPNSHDYWGAWQATLTSLGELASRVKITFKSPFGEFGIQ